MLIQQATNRNKKASSAITLKASNLKVVPSERNTSMNNSTAVNINNQVSQAYSATSDAFDAITQTMECFGGLHALFNSIWIQCKDNPSFKNTDIFHAAKLGCNVCGDFNNTLDCYKEDLEKHLKALGGVNHE